MPRPDKIEELYDALDEIKYICEEAPRPIDSDSEEAHTLDENIDEILDEVNWALR